MFKNKVEVLTADNLLRVHLTQGKCTVVDDTVANRELLVNCRFVYHTARRCAVTRMRGRMVALSRLIVALDRSDRQEPDPAKYAMHPKYFDSTVEIDPLAPIDYVAKQE